MSFSMIFSIIMIIAFVGIAIYAITTFLHWGKCGEIGLYYNELQNEVTKAWQGEISRSVFKAKIPIGIEKVCFGNLTQTPDVLSREEQEFLRKYESSNGNIFMYLPEKACDQQLASTTIKHARTEKFFCVLVEREEAAVKLIKEVDESEVLLESG